MLYQIPRYSNAEDDVKKAQAEILCIVNGQPSACDNGEISHNGFIICIINPYSFYLLQNPLLSRVRIPCLMGKKSTYLIKAQLKCVSHSFGQRLFIDF